MSYYETHFISSYQPISTFSKDKTCSVEYRVYKSDSSACNKPISRSIVMISRLRNMNLYTSFDFHLLLEWREHVHIGFYTQTDIFFPHIISIRTGSTRFT